MQSDKLARLRARYARGGGEDFHDPAFKKVAERQFAGDRRRWPFMDVATFLGAPYRPEAAGEEFTGLDVAILGIPMDLGVTNRGRRPAGPARRAGGRADRSLRARAAGGAPRRGEGGRYRRYPDGEPFLIGRLSR